MIFFAACIFSIQLILAISSIPLFITEKQAYHYLQPFYLILLGLEGMAAFGLGFSSPQIMPMPDYSFDGVYTKIRRPSVNPPKTQKIDSDMNKASLVLYTLYQIRVSKPFSKDHLEITLTLYGWATLAGILAIPIAALLCGLGAFIALQISPHLGVESFNKFAVLALFFPICAVISGFGTGQLFSCLSSMQNRIQVFDSLGQDVTQKFFYGKEGMRDLTIKIREPTINSKEHSLQ